MIGREGELCFWEIAQHSDFDPNFQAKVIEKLKIEVEKKNANPQNYGLLVDRVLINTGKPQLYGTQVTYNSFGQAYPIDLADSSNVNKRRIELGFEPLEKYLNSMTQMHFEMNKDLFIKMGILEPRLYKTQMDSIKK